MLSCASSPPPPPPISGQSVILFVPGYKGSALKDKQSGRRIWVTAREELFGDRSLALPLPEHGDPLERNLVVDGVLDSVSVIPGIFRIPVYSGWLDWLKEEFGAHFLIVPFAYDWRQDNVETVAALSKQVSELREQGASQIIIIAHSMGGLISSYYLRYGNVPLSQAVETWDGASEVDAVVLLGTPFLGAAAVFRDMQIGAINKFNTTLLNQLAISSFQSSYQLLPPPFAEMLISAENGRPMQEVVFSSAEWQLRNWGLFKTPELSTDAATARAEYLEKQLSRSARFYSLLHAPLEATPASALPLLSVTGEGQLTLLRVLAAEDGLETRLAYDEATLDAIGKPRNRLLVAGDGDNVVGLQSAELPAAMLQAHNVESLRITALHSELGIHPEAQNAIAAFIAARKRQWK